MAQTDWTILETEFGSSELHPQETLFTLGNGYLGTRGTFEEGYPGASLATFIHGVYDEALEGYTELVNCPDWLPLAIKVGSDCFRPKQG
ncbi:Maltose phosphorylase / Trehalose phosphorylase [uncultured Leptolyngbya sp.]|uniref:Maltose phosphorylase / Trehalose phosphorylase n=1 Tax=uncultured Leptolyngbya sp. TaxID=332963 RepID=A0A6J4MJ95_9CYAN|nr:Maltose phosphorylase / Trehalose phosphorylase [uncultured Leptolyngbya sp.]